MMPNVMTSHPTTGWESRALSLWAVTNDPMHSSDMRSNIIDNRADDDDDDDEDDEDEIREVENDDCDDEEDRCGRNVDCPTASDR